MKDIIISSSNRGAGYCNLRFKWGVYGDGDITGDGNGYEDRYGCKYWNGNGELKMWVLI
jgi:hypothetical protein